MMQPGVMGFVVVAGLFKMMMLGHAAGVRRGNGGQHESRENQAEDFFHITCADRFKDTLVTIKSHFALALPASGLTTVGDAGVSALDFLPFRINVHFLCSF
jgi:hypothetical protein